jgi:hypothetical protein
LKEFNGDQPNQSISEEVSQKEEDGKRMDTTRHNLSKQRVDEN